MSETAVVRHDWQLDEVIALHDAPLFELVDRARAVHRQAHPDGRVQLCALLSVQTGACTEDCSYCAQSVRHPSEPLPPQSMSVDEVRKRAVEAKERGSSRLCMGAAGRRVREGQGFEALLEMVREVKVLGLEVCCTLGMLSPRQAAKLRQAGLDVYNHNLDTSRQYYPSIVTTHGYDDRLATLRAVREAGIGVCSGGIVGMGETVRDRCALLVELASFTPQPESVPINALVPIAGTPLEGRPPVRPLELVRMIATARVLMPHARVRLAAGRSALSREEQLLCLYAGANSIFFGEKLLTTPNASVDEDAELLEEAGLVPAPPRGH